MNAARASLLALLMCWAFAALADIAVPPLTGRVVDQTGTLSSGDISALTQTLKNLEMRKGSQVAVLIVPTTEPETIEQYSIRVADAWKIGRKKIDDGALMVIAKNDRHLRIEVGYGLEGALTDVTTRRIIDEVITPKFKAGDFAGGISAGVDRIIRVIDGETLPAPEPPHWQSQRSFDPTDLFNPFLIIPVLLLGGAMRSLLGRLLGSVAAGGLVTVIGWYLFGSLLAAVLAGVIASIFVMFSDSITSPQSVGRRGGGGGWSGGGYGGSFSGSGSGSSDSGGFSGGGGGFGGGGASGSW
ncbi:TPM domain-containing protein [Bradyrhizobium sp.]|uniref:TPM domain-containing protein n=1 Tax=Bradyrhizobium sp. TaxID=376 RepID=UPI003BB0C64E